MPLATRTLSPCGFLALLLAACGGGGGGVDNGGNQPLGLEIQNPVEKASYPLGDLDLVVSWSDAAEAPDSFEVLLNDKPEDTQLSAGGNQALGSLSLPELGPQELEVRAFRAGQLIEFKRREFIVTTPPFPGLVIQATFISEQTSIAFGQTGSRLGDLDADGQSEFVIGARLADFAGAAAGQLQVLSSTGGEPVLEANGAPGSEFGEGLAWSPDRDGDGRPDILVGAPLDDTGASNGGKVTLLSSLTGAPLLVLVGTEQEEFLGNSIASLEDINGDGIGEILVGGAKSNVAGGFSGRVSLFSGADGARLLKIDGEEPVVQLGIAVDGFGDQNGDGTPDLLVGCWGATDNGGSSGAVIIFSGLDGAQLLRIPGEFEDDHFGLDVCAFPDLDGDGVREILTGAWEHDPAGNSNAGAAYLHSGRTGALLRKFVGENVEDRFGTQVAAAGDFDGDKICDVLVGAPFTNTSQGSTYLFSGATGLLLNRLDGFAPIALSGSCLEGLGDVDGDGWPEFMVGAPIEVFDQQPYGTVRVVGRAESALSALASGGAGPDSLAAVAEGLMSAPTSLPLVPDPAALRRLVEELKAAWPRSRLPADWAQRIAPR